MAHSIAVRRSYNSRVTWGNVGLAIGFDEYTCKAEKEKADYTTFNSLGSRESATCVAWAGGSFKGKWNAAVNAFDTGIYPRDDAGPCTVYISVADPTSCTFSVLTLSSTSFNSSLSQKLVDFAADYESNAPFTLPTGSYGQIAG